MLKEAGALFAIVGHSERRIAGDTSERVRGQLESALAKGLVPILCVGEREREADGEHFSFIENQLASALRGLSAAAIKKLVVAYEPVWAIGKHAADAMRPAELQQMVIFIRKVLSGIVERRVALKVPILYGGSVEPSNAKELVVEGGAGGFLVGHASTTPETFFEILEAIR
jgi:triosephosphate isomerase